MITFKLLSLGQSHTLKIFSVFSCYLCHLCGKMFAAHKNLRAHLATHKLSKVNRIDEDKAGLNNVNSKTALCSEKHLADSAVTVTTTDLKLSKGINIFFYNLINEIFPALNTLNFVSFYKFPDNQRRKRSLQDVDSVEQSSYGLEAKRNCILDNCIPGEKKKQETYLDMLLQKFSSIKIKEIFNYQQRYQI